MRECDVPCLALLPWYDVNCLALLPWHMSRGARNNAFPSHLMSHIGDAATLTSNVKIMHTERRWWVVAYECILTVYRSYVSVTLPPHVLGSKISPESNYFD